MWQASFLPTVGVLPTLVLFFQLKTLYHYTLLWSTNVRTNLRGQRFKALPGRSWEECDRKQEQPRRKSKRLGWLFEGLRHTHENRFTVCIDEWTLWVLELRDTMGESEKVLATKCSCFLVWASPPRQREAKENRTLFQDELATLGCVISYSSTT